MDNVNDVTVDLSDDISTMSYDDYYYYSRQLDNIINNQNTIIQNQSKSFDLVNQGFTFLSFLCVIYFLYIFIKNIIEKFKTRYAGENWIKSLFSSESWQ